MVAMHTENEAPPTVETVTFWSVMRQIWETVEVTQITNEDLATSFLEPQRAELATKRAETKRALRAYWGTAY